MANTSSNALSRRSWDRFSLVFIESGCSTAGMQVSQVCVCVCVFCNRKLRGSYGRDPQSPADQLVLYAAGDTRIYIQEKVSLKCSRRTTGSPLACQASPRT